MRLYKSGVKYASHLTHFCYSILELKLYYQEKSSINFDDHANVTSGANYKSHLMQFCY